MAEQRAEKWVVAEKDNVDDVKNWQCLAPSVHLAPGLALEQGKS